MRPTPSDMEGSSLLLLDLSLVAIISHGSLRETNDAPFPSSWAILIDPTRHLSVSSNSPFVSSPAQRHTRKTFPIQTTHQLQSTSNADDSPCHPLLALVNPPLQSAIPLFFVVSLRSLVC